MSRDLTAYFNQLIAEQHLVHGYVFTGDNHEGKVSMTKHIIQALACPNFNKDRSPCKACEICRRIEADQFPDAMYIEPDGRFIRVDQIRSLKQWLATSPVEATFKIAVIEQAEAMNPQSSNALLTFLEEPVENVFIILYSRAASNLLPTIQSRVQQVHFATEEAGSRADELEAQGVSSVHATILAQMSTDSIEFLLEEYDEVEMEKWFKALNSFYRALYMQDERAFIMVQTQLKPFLSVQQALFGADYLLLLNHSAMLINQVNNRGKQPLIQQYMLTELDKHRPANIGQLLQINDGLLKVNQYIQANVPPQLAFEQLTIEVVYRKSN